MQTRQLALLPVIAAAGIALLSACGGTTADGAGPSVAKQAATTTPASPTAPASPTTQAPTAATSHAATGGAGTAAKDGAGDVDCGPVDGGQHLMATATANATVGCTEAFDVLDEYSKHPVSQSDGTMREVKLPSGWDCAMAPYANPNPSGTLVVHCSKGSDFQFYTKPV